MLLLPLVVSAALFAAAPLPGPPTRWLTDGSGALGREVSTRLDARLESYQRATGHQVLVYLTPSTGGVPIDDWAAAAFKTWQVGRSRLDDGVVLFVFTQDRTARIEVGYGLEDRLTDAASARILRDVLGPRMAAGEPEQAISAALDALLTTIGEAAPVPGETRIPSVFEWVGLIVAGLLLGLLFWRHPMLAMLLLSMVSGRRGRNRMSPGGGRSGGAGASGRW